MNFVPLMGALLRVPALIEFARGTPGKGASECALRLQGSDVPSERR
jgi:hypothetical protein